MNLVIVVLGPVCRRPGFDNTSLPTPSVSYLANSVTTPSTLKNDRKRTFRTNKGKKRLVLKGDWIVVQSKLLENQSKPYTNQKGKSFPEKNMQWPCSCRIKRFEAFIEDERFGIFKNFGILLTDGNNGNI